MKIAMAGQPNGGKSTISNSIAGYKAITSNFPGTTVQYTEIRTHIFGYTCQSIDLPGTYSLTAGDAAEREARRHLLSGEVDVIINVVDASLLIRSLELTLQLLELELPMVLCLNMIDEAQRKGIQINVQKLSGLLGLPVIPTIATTRKELSMIMLTQALGTSEELTVMTKAQVMVFTVFVTFYIPCLATIATLWREIGKKGVLLAILFTLSVAFILAIMTRVFWGIIL
jgi:small GTP-binding protein